MKIFNDKKQMNLNQITGTCDGRHPNEISDNSEPGNKKENVQAKTKISSLFFNTWFLQFKKEGSIEQPGSYWNL